MRLFTHGTILTMDPTQPTVEAVLVGDNGRIAALGARDSLRPPAGTRTVDLGGGTLLPGFNDAHVHLWKLGLLLTVQANVRAAPSIEALQAALRAHAAQRPQDTWLQARGYDETALGRHPTTADLDAVTTERPVVVTRMCGHIMALNSCALALADITAQTADPPGGVILRDAHGVPTGVIQENAMALVNAVLPPPDHATLIEAILAAQQHQLTHGITSATDPLLLPDHIAVYTRLATDGDLLARVNGLAVRRPDGASITLPLPHRFDHPMLRIDSVKFFADGGLSGATAAIALPYKQTGTRGVLRYADEDLYILAREAHAAGYRIAVHAIGDMAIEQVLDVFDALCEEMPGAPRHRIEHLGLPTPEQLARAARLGIMTATQPVFLHALGHTFRSYLPDVYLPRCYPFHAMMDAGLSVAFSSDAPVVPDDNPLLGIRAAIQRADMEGYVIAPEQAVALEDALRAYTLGGAVLSGDARNRGRIAQGLWADFVLLSGNPLAVSHPSALTELAVWGTYVGGLTAYEN